MQPFLHVCAGSGDARWRSAGKLPAILDDKHDEHPLRRPGVADVEMLEFGRFSLNALIKAGIFDDNATQSTVVSLQKTLYASRATTTRRRSWAKPTCS